ncbi:MAG: hypothetical protein ACN6NS_01525 [Acinetobacter johnsonii]
MVSHRVLITVAIAKLHFKIVQEKKIMELSFLSIFGCLLIVGGLLLPIYTANLFPLSKESNDQYQEMMRKGDRGWIIDFKINQWIRKNWTYIPILGVLFFLIGLLF